MDLSVSTVTALLLACLALASWTVQASDPELTSDFAVPPGVNASSLDGNFFTSTVLRNVSSKPGTFATVTRVTEGSFAALQGLGLSTAFLQFSPGAVNVPHLHPRSSEILFVLAGVLDVRVVDSTNKLFSQTLQVGDLFVFPQGLVHFEINNQTTGALALSSFGSSNPGVLRLPNTLFKSNTPDDILEKSFGVSSYVIDQLKAATVD